MAEKHHCGVYMLISKNPKYYGCIYIGFTVNPKRRIKQHNRGKDYGGAKKTSGKGPWDMVLMVNNFPNQIAALRFEWAWQHPNISRLLRQCNKKKRSENGYSYHLRLLDHLLSNSPWNRLPLTVLMFYNDIQETILPNKPSHMKFITYQKDAKIDKKKSKQIMSEDDDDDEDVNCKLCELNLDSCYKVKCYKCKNPFHRTCLANHLSPNHLIPVTGKCPVCKESIYWGEVLFPGRYCLTF